MSREVARAIRAELNDRPEFKEVSLLGGVLRGIANRLDPPQTSREERLEELLHNRDLEVVLTFAAVTGKDVAPVAAARFVQARKELDLERG